MDRQRVAHATHHDLANAERADARLADLPAARHAQEVAKHLQAAHAHEDGDIQEAVRGVRLGDEREAESMERAIADGDRRRCSPVPLPVGDQPDRRLASLENAPGCPGCR